MHKQKNKTISKVAKMDETKAEIQINKIIGYSKMPNVFINKNTTNTCKNILLVSSWFVYLYAQNGGSTLLFIVVIVSFRLITYMSASTHHFNSSCTFINKIY